MTDSLAFFGAFNPPTVAHLELARFAAQAADVKQVIFVPSKSVYIRDEQGKDFAYSDAQRAAMLRAAAERRPWMRVTDWEMRQPRQPRTYETLCYLRETGWSPALLLGSDKLAELEHGWLHVEEIAREFGIVCLTRGQDEIPRMIGENAYLASLARYIRVLETPPETRAVSSTRVRRCVREMKRLGEEINGMVTPEIRALL